MNSENDSSEGKAIYVQQDGQPMGPFSDADIRMKIEEGTLSPNDLGWTNGTVQWVPLRELISLDLPGFEEPIQDSAAAAIHTTNPQSWLAEFRGIYQMKRDPSASFWTQLNKSRGALLVPMQPQGVRTSKWRLYAIAGFLITLPICLLLTPILGPFALLLLLLGTQWVGALLHFRFNRSNPDLERVTGSGGRSLAKPILLAGIVAASLVFLFALGGVLKKMATVEISPPSSLGNASQAVAAQRPKMTMLDAEQYYAQRVAEQASQNGRGITITQPMKCPTCQGAGDNRLSRFNGPRCTACGGQGTLRTPSGYVVACSKCGGPGSSAEKCRRCNGTGVITP